jgi:hypothetical protein
MGAAIIRCVAALARKAVRQCKRGPMSATDAREEPSVVLTACQGCSALSAAACTICEPP